MPRRVRAKPTSNETTTADETVGGEDGSNSQTQEDSEAATGAKQTENSTVDVESKEEKRTDESVSSKPRAGGHQRLAPHQLGVGSSAASTTVSPASPSLPPSASSASNKSARASLISSSTTNRTRRFGPSLTRFRERIHRQPTLPIALHHPLSAAELKQQSLRSHFPQLTNSVGISADAQFELWKSIIAARRRGEHSEWSIEAVPECWHDTDFVKMKGELESEPHELGRAFLMKRVVDPRLSSVQEVMTTTTKARFDDYAVRNSITGNSSDTWENATTAKVSRTCCFRFVGCCVDGVQAGCTWLVRIGRVQRGNTQQGRSNQRLHQVRGFCHADLPFFFFLAVAD
jgi:hypothetical protein